MDTNAIPTFLFLFETFEPSSVLPPGRPRLAAFNPHETLGFVYDDDDGWDMPEEAMDTDAIARAMGYRDERGLLMGMAFQDAPTVFGMNLLVLLRNMEPEGAHAADLPDMLPSNREFYENGALLRTRDALVWVHTVENGLGPTIEPGSFLDTVCVQGTDLGRRMADALDAAGLALPQGQTLEGAAAACFVGIVLPYESAHARLGAMARLKDDLALLTTLGQTVDGRTRTIVPVLL